MNIVTTFDRLIPRRAAIMASWPVYKGIEALAAIVSDGWTLTYRGDGEFTYTGDREDRELGQLEGSLGCLPAIVAFALATQATLLAPNDDMQAAVALPLAAVLFLSVRAMNEVSVHRAGGDPA